MAMLSVSSGCFITHDYEHVKSMLDSTKADGFELIVYSSIIDNIPSLIDEFSDLNRPIFSIHAPKVAQTLLSDPLFGQAALRLLKQTASTASALGASIMVVHAWDGRYRKLSMGSIKRSLELLVGHCNDIGVKVSIEALPSRYKRPSELVGELLSSSDDLSFTIDFEYAAAYGMFGELMEFSDRLSNVHLRDYNGMWLVDGKRAYLKPGSGDLDFKKLISMIRNRGYDSLYTIEAPYRCVEELNDAIYFFKGLI
ncbi:MAG: sugar phosphate isomerase/epimerase [Candidatus Methanofastidiosa archaeon]|nr:sugar phosphate isomerase/epimerase [Candidatus Methanofastidiosa archaeon]